MMNLKSNFLNILIHYCSAIVLVEKSLKVVYH
jgi:hypothetical protein